jgi:hypothetical protein
MEGKDALRNAHALLHFLLPFRACKTVAVSGFRTNRSHPEDDAGRDEERRPELLLIDFGTGSRPLRFQ